jgi:hypothetical protein
VLVLLITVVVAFPAGVNVVLLIIGSSFARLPVGDNFVCLLLDDALV